MNLKVVVVLALLKGDQPAFINGSMRTKKLPLRWLFCGYLTHLLVADLLFFDQAAQFSRVFFDAIGETFW